MRKIILFFAAVLLASVGWSQTMNIHYKSGQTVKYNMNNIDYVEFSEEQQNNTHVSSDKAVDLGLSVKWASCNVGANSPEEKGDKFSWGETNPKTGSGGVSNYLYYDSNTESYIDIGIDIKGTDYDVAHVKWGGNWRMPTYTELCELRERCIWEWAQYNGVNGWVVKGNNGNSIFFPVGKESIYLWASDMEVKSMGGKYGISHCICFSNVTYQFSNSGISRSSVAFVRPVCPQ
ncbi:MAG: hypothetical protein IKY01_05360 [Prevotella sp.]|nr:hypothetical protein [Prevotella sp.]